MSLPSPKLKPSDKQEEKRKPSPLKKISRIATEVALETMQTGQPPALDHMAKLHGLGLLSELANVGEMVIGQRHGPSTPSDLPQVNPRKQIKPRSQIKPR